MNIHVFDRSFNIVGVIDDYVSCIWTPKYYECGDFELYVASSCEMVNLLRENYYLVRSTDISVSNGVITYKKVMVIKNINLTTDVENGDYLTVTGRELKFLLNSRIIWNMTTLVGNVVDCINKIVTENCISPTDTKRVIPYLTVSSAPSGIIDALSKQYTGTNVMTAIEEVCVTYGLGYTVYVVNNNGVVSMPLQIYKGVDRSYNQSVNPIVLFSSAYDNLYNTEYALNTENYFNAAKIGGEGEGIQRVYSQVGTASGLDRYEIFVDAKDISSEDNPDIETIVSGIRTQITNKEAEITNKETQITNKEAEIASQKESVNTITQSVNMAYANVEQMTVQVRSIQNEINEIQSTIIRYKTYLVELNEKYDIAIKQGHTQEAEDIREEIKLVDRRLEAELSELQEAKSKYNVAYDNLTVAKNDFFRKIGDLDSAKAQLNNLNKDLELLNQQLVALNNSLDSLNNQLSNAINYTYDHLLQERGYDKLAELTITEEFSGEVLEDVAYNLGTDYDLGDIVTVINEYGITANSRILSIIESVDENGTVSLIPNFGTWEV